MPNITPSRKRNDTTQIKSPREAIRSEGIYLGQLVDFRRVFRFAPENRKIEFIAQCSQHSVIKF